MRRLLAFGGAALGLMLLPGTAGATAAAAGAGFGSNWPVYHENPTSNGVAAVATNLTPLSSAWTSPILDGQLYGSPLVEQGRVVIATESDTVYVMSARSG